MLNLFPLTFWTLKHTLAWKIYLPGKGHLGLPVGGLLLGGGGLGGAVPLVLVPAELFEAERGRYDLPGRVLPLLRLWEGVLQYMTSTSGV